MHVGCLNSIPPGPDGGSRLGIRCGMSQVRGRLSKTQAAIWRCEFCDGRFIAGQYVEFIGRFVVHNDLSICWPPDEDRND